VIEEYNPGVDVNLICLVHGMVPATTFRQRRELQDPHRRAYVLAEFHPKILQACCVSTMLSQQKTYQTQPSAAIIVVNPTEALPFYDRREVGYIDGMKLTTDLWSADRLLWASETPEKGLATEFIHLKRYVSSELNQCQWTLEDYAFVKNNPGGTLDHMLRYHVGAKRRAIGIEPVPKYTAPKGNLLAVQKNHKI